MLKKSLITLTIASVLSLTACSSFLENLGKVPQNYTQAVKQGVLEQKYTRMG
ncbi:hypothetical protein ACGTJS_06500 [Faucicola mancuniensis]|uniref:hypothetical protein n=1 Tax=Faucicola mancuniensis TaxID=1309795 RepID=UPI00397784D5